MLSNHSSSDAVLTMELVAGEPRQPRIHLARHAVLDRHDVRQLGDPRAQLRAHQIAGVRVAPHRDADVDLLADRLVVLVERLVLLVQEVQHRRVHHDVVRSRSPARAWRARSPCPCSGRSTTRSCRRCRRSRRPTISNERLRSATDIEKNSLCLPAMNTPSMPRSSTQCRRLRAEARLVDREVSANGISAAAQMPFMLARA